MLLKAVNVFVLLVFLISLENACAWKVFSKGHRSGGNLIPPHENVSREQLPPDQWFDQKLDHFSDNNNELWKQVLRIKFYVFFLLNE